MTRTGGPATRTFLLEVGCEEIPAGMLPAALADLAQRLRAALGSLLPPSPEGVEPEVPFGTPRRLVACLQGVLDREQDRVALVSGPPVSASYDPQGQPTKAAIGFAKAQGVAIEGLERMTGEKGEVVAARKTIVGRSSLELLAEACPKALGAMRFPKMMKWGDKGYLFVRPVHWIVALLDDQVVDFEFMGVRSGRLTRGHRFLAPGPHEIRRASDYDAVLTERGGVIPRPGLRRQMIVERRAQAAAAMGWAVSEDETLLTELVNLNEHPGVIAGSFPASFLELPAPVLVTAMKHHQKYFPVLDARGELAPGFLAVINLVSDPDGGIRRGNEWVLKARLADASFFWNEDRKRPLADRVADLSRITFHEKLGSNLARVDRLGQLVGWLGAECRIDAEGAAHAAKAARLCKADLTTGMVGEFPELQGIMGGIYARAEGLPAPVARAIEEHYRPTSGTDACPSTAAGCLLALVDKLDLLAGCFAAGLVPKGSADPYGLRRAALGVCRILLSAPMVELPGRPRLGGMVAAALKGYTQQKIEPQPGAETSLVEFISQRLRFLMEEQGISLDTARAVLAAGVEDLHDAWLRAGALTSLRGPEHESDFDSLATSAKRIRNILSQARGKGIEAAAAAVQPSRLVDAEEKDLHGSLVRVAAGVEVDIAARDYRAALRSIASLRKDVDRFFDKVLVMAPDEALRANRLAILAGLSALLSRVADFSEIVVAGDSHLRGA